MDNELHRNERGGISQLLDDVDDEDDGVDRGGQRHHHHQHHHVTTADDDCRTRIVVDEQEPEFGRFLQKNVSDWRRFVP